MLAQEFTTAVEARIQSEVAKFLSLKQTLVSLQGSTNLIIQSRAAQLLQNQQTLEDELPGVMTILKNIKLGAYTMSDVTYVGVFARNMEQQIKDVNALSKGHTNSLPVMTPIWFIAILGLVAGGLYFAKRAS